jgi:hypothetical protein
MRVPFIKGRVSEMSPFDLWCKIHDAVNTVPGCKVVGNGSVLVPPYTTDIVVEVDDEQFSIEITKLGARAAAAPV